MSDLRVRRQLALGAAQLFLLTTMSLSLAAVARAQDDTEPPALTLEMTADLTTFTAIDEVIGYEYRLTNTGGVALEMLLVTDDVLGDDVTCPSGPLEPDGSVVCVGYYTITQDDVDAGSVTNRAQGHGQYIDEDVASDEVSLTITLLAPEPTEPPGTPEPPGPPALMLEMAADWTTFSAVDDPIFYEYRLTNTGGVTLDAVSVGDTWMGSVTCPSGPLEPGGSLVCDYGYLITQDDIDAGSVHNIAQASGTYGEGEVVDSNEARLTVTFLAPAPPGPPALTLEVRADPATFSAVDEVIGYEYRLTNTGSVALDNLSVGDTWVGDVSCPSGFLEPGRSVSCLSGYLITQDDIDAGSVHNIAQASGIYGEDEEVLSNEVSLTITSVATAPALTLKIRADAATFSAVDEVIGYEYWLTNTGGVALDAVRVVDTKVEDVTCPPEPLDPDASLICEGDYFTTQDDIDAGSLSNIAQGYGTYGESGAEVASDAEAGLTIIFLAPEPPALTLEIRADADTFSPEDDEIGYEYLLTNTGGVALDAVRVTGTNVGDVTCPSAFLEPGGSVVCEGDYAITQTDVDAGSVTNTAQGIGTYGESGAEVASDEVSVTIPYVAPE